MAEKKGTNDIDKKLIIVESPTKARTIGKILGSQCKVLASNGHIRTLPKNDLCIDIKNGYKPKYVLDETKEKSLAAIKSELKNASELILATDEDREGESISWHLLEVLKPKVPYRRMVFHEITKSAITKAFNEGRDLDMNLVHAQETRRILDRLYGYTISPVLWSKLSNKNLSAGRVQSPGLRLVVDREKSRMAFEKSSYWDVVVFFKEKFDAKLVSVDGKRVADGENFDSETGAFKTSPKVILLDEKEAQLIADSLKDATFTISKIETKNTKQRPYAPFTTSTLQQEGNRKLHMSTKDTMRVAQSLYENGFITYMRTDSPALSEEGMKGARDAAVSMFGIDMVPTSPRIYKAKDTNAQEAHEAIRPAGDVFRKPEETGLSGRELALYDLIWKRTIASQMKDADKCITTVTINSNDGRSCVFVVTGTTIVFPGFLRVYVEGYDDPELALENKERLLPILSENQVLTFQSAQAQGHETKEKARYTEASLVKALEELGIGRPSTYATIIDRLFEKNYVVRKGDALVPTFMGWGVIQLLENHFSHYVDYKFTSAMEEDLDEMASGKIDELAYLKKFFEGESGLDYIVKSNKGAIDSKIAKKLDLPQLSEGCNIYLGPFGPYVKGNSDKFISVPSEWFPFSVDDNMVRELMAGKEESSLKEKESKGPEILGNTSDGRPVFHCTGRYGDYWQIGDLSKEKDNIQRYTIPKGLENVSLEMALKFFSLPRLVGKMEDGSEITADMGKYGPYVKSGNDFRSINGPQAIFDITEQEARELLASPKKTKTASKTTRARTLKSEEKTSSQSTVKTSGVVLDFGSYNGENLSIYVGKYGYYLKHGSTNYRIPKEMRNNEELCKTITMEQAISYMGENK
ncbi:MAG: type I DNA topoisomerase [Sphaerochaetaceae bacterium]|nr:type I DNA topoisomerase [Sphaerochaetaceae bacterium]